MISHTLDLAGIVLAVANEQQLTELAHEVNISRATFGRIRRSHRPWVAERVVEAARSAMSQLGTYGVTEETLTDLEARIDAANTGLKQPRATITARKAAGAQLAALFAEVDALLGGQIDRLVFPLRESNREFYVAYRSARSVVDRPGSSRGSIGTNEASPAAPLATASQEQQKAAA
jgi:hypothetical protein